MLSPRSRRSPDKAPPADYPIHPRSPALRAPQSAMIASSDKSRAAPCRRLAALVRLVPLVRASTSLKGRAQVARRNPKRNQLRLHVQAEPGSMARPRGSRLGTDVRVRLKSRKGDQWPTMRGRLHPTRTKGAVRRSLTAAAVRLQSHCGSGEVRKGADMLFVPPAEPISEPSPMPVNMAPGTPQSSPATSTDIPPDD